MIAASSAKSIRETTEPECLVCTFFVLITTARVYIYTGSDLCTCASVCAVTRRRMFDRACVHACVCAHTRVFTCRQACVTFVQNTGQRNARQTSLPGGCWQSTTLTYTEWWQQIYVCRRSGHAVCGWWGDMRGGEGRGGEEREEGGSLRLFCASLVIVCHSDNDLRDGLEGKVEEGIEVGI